MSVIDLKLREIVSVFLLAEVYTVSVLGRDKGYTVKYIPLPEGVPEGEARGNSNTDIISF